MHGGRGGGREIDYFLIDGRITGGIGDGFVYSVEDFQEGSPHSIVGLRVRASAPRDMAQQLVRPKSFPTSRPVGPVRWRTTDFAQLSTDMDGLLRNAEMAAEGQAVGGDRVLEDGVGNGGFDGSVLSQFAQPFVP